MTITTTNLVSFRSGRAEVTPLSCGSHADAPIQECLECRLTLIMFLCKKNHTIVSTRTTHHMHAQTEALLSLPIPHT